MKVILVALSLACCALAGEVEYSPKGGLLIFPSKRVPTSTTTTTTTTVAPVSVQSQRYTDGPSDKKGAGLSGVNAYYVQVPADRLQAVRTYKVPQYNQVQQKVESGRYSDGQSDNLGAGLSGVNAYYVQVPADRLQAVRTFPGQQKEFGTSEQYSQPLEVEGQFLPLQVVTPEDLAKYWNQ